MTGPGSSTIVCGIIIRSYIKSSTVGRAPPALRVDGQVSLASNHRILDVDYHVFPGTRAANQQVSRRRRLERLGIIQHRPGNQPALAGMANSGPARPAHRDVTGFGEFQHALELRVPANRKPGASKGNSWTFTVG